MAKEVTLTISTAKQGACTITGAEQDIIAVGMMIGSGLTTGQTAGIDVRVDDCTLSINLPTCCNVGGIIEAMTVAARRGSTILRSPT